METILLALSDSKGAEEGAEVRVSLPPPPQDSRGHPDLLIVLFYHAGSGCDSPGHLLWGEDWVASRILTRTF